MVSDDDGEKLCMKGGFRRASEGGETRYEGRLSFSGRSSM